MNVNPYDSPQNAGQAPQPAPKAKRFTLIELLVVIGVICVLIALLLPNVRGSAQAARRAVCQNNLRQIATALLNYEEVNDCLPPAYTVDASGKPLHSWRTLILPYLEQKALYDKIDLAKPWDDPANRAAFESRIAVYHCPSSDSPPTHTTYLAAVCEGSCLRPIQPRRLEEVTDDKSLTLLVVEVDAEHSVHWMAPTDASERLIVGFAESRRLPHVSGIQAAYVDGRVGFISKQVKPAALRAIITLAGNDDELAQEVD